MHKKGRAVLELFLFLLNAAANFFDEIDVPSR